MRCTPTGMDSVTVSFAESLQQSLPASARDAQTRRVLGALAELLERNGIAIEDIGSINKAGLYQGFYKDNEGESHVVDLANIEFSPAWSQDPAWPGVQQAKPVTAKPRPAPKAVRGEQTIIIAPDPQFGFRRYEDGTLDPFHDDRAIDLHLQIIRDAKPDTIINLGDSVDLAEWSDRWAVQPEMVLTTQPALDRTHRHLAEQLTEAPDGCQVLLLEGNHDARLSKLIVKNALAAVRLRQANAPESWPVMTMPHLLRLDDFGAISDGQPRVRYIDGYPAGRVEIAPGSADVTPLYAIHGERLSVSAVAKNERQSFVQGHIHRIQDWWESYELAGQLINVNAWSPGCLCRIDGSVPSVRGGTRVSGRPVARQEQWQQGMGVVTVLADGTWSKEIIPFLNGRAVWRGKEYRSTFNQAD